MVDFKKRLAKRIERRVRDPVAIYGTLDRASDKGPLRPAQRKILQNWHDEHRSKRDLIIKLHTGEGKTLIGLLMLQSKLNEDEGPALYLCYNNFLVNQTCEQASQFGVAYCTCEPNGDLPPDFQDGNAILITSVHKLFNGLTKFGTGVRSKDVGALVIDDAHACVDAIRDAFLIRLSRQDQAYAEIIHLFSSDLKKQGMGTYADIENQDYDAYLPVPYWAWRENREDVVSILAKHSQTDAVRFAWPLVRDHLADCMCVVSGASLVIAPYLPPLDHFGSYSRAKQRIFMSATVINDSFLVKGLGLSAETIRAPLVYEEQVWSGEKMVLIPWLIDKSLDRSTVVEKFGKPRSKVTFGVVALVPSFRRTKDWVKYGATVAERATIDREIQNLREKKFGTTLVFSNRYDGIDLPDASCRVLILDSKPYSDNLIDRYAEGCRRSSTIMATRTARTIEQGLGRGVRGEKDYSVIILTGADLIESVRSSKWRRLLSHQTRRQVEIGLEIAEMAKEEIESGTDPWAALRSIINQCLNRDSGWKNFYVEKMDAVKSDTPGGDVLAFFEIEIEAERKFQAGDISGAIRNLQNLIDDHVADETERGWYLQEMARYRQVDSKAESNHLQGHAHRRNRFLLKPQSGMQVDKIEMVSQKRMEKIIQWVRRFENHDELMVGVESIVARLAFGVRAERFEQAFDELAACLGFKSQRPDKEWKEGPDNLWGLSQSEYLLVECKNEVAVNRTEISKREAQQMDSSCAWFKKFYKGVSVKNIMIIPTNRLAKGVFLSHPVEATRKKELEKLVFNVRSFFSEFRSMNLDDLSERKVQELVNANGLSVAAILSKYSKPIVLPRSS